MGQMLHPLTITVTTDSLVIHSEDQHPLSITVRQSTEATQKKGWIFEQVQAAAVTLPAPYVLAITLTKLSSAMPFKHGTASSLCLLSVSTNPWYSTMAASSALTSKKQQAAPAFAMTTTISALGSVAVAQLTASQLHKTS